MAFWIVDTRNLPGGKSQAFFEMDSMADVPDLPQLSDKCCEGSDAFAILEKKLVGLCSDGVWR